MKHLRASFSIRIPREGRVLLVYFLAVLSGSPKISAQEQNRTWVQRAELTARNGTSSDGFGSSVAIGGNIVIVGAPLAAVGGNEREGAAYVFVKPANGWGNMQQVATLTASDGGGDLGFGSSVAISGDTVVVGTCCSGQGGGYVFTKPRKGWRDSVEKVKVSYPGYDCLAAAVDADTVVCAYGPVGAVYSRPKGGWRYARSYTALLRATDPSVTFFSLAIDHGVVVAGDWESNNSQGAAYVFVKPKPGWGVTNVGRIQTQTAKLTASDGAADDGLGWSVAIHGNTVAVGAPGHSANECNYCGAAYVFVKPVDGWIDMTQTAELTDAKLQSQSNLGSSVAIQGRTLLAGNPNGGNGDNHVGSVDLFVEPSGGWTNTQGPNATLTASDGERFDNFGISAGISGKTIVIGSDRSNINLTGAAYVFGH